MSIAKKVLAEYKVGKTVGEGAFSKVKLGIHKATGEKVAVKIISKKRLEASYKKKERDRREREKRAEKKKQEKMKKEQELIKQGKIPTAPPLPPEMTDEDKRQKKVEKERQAEKDEELLDQLPGQFSKSLSREVRLLQSLHHPNIIRLYQVVETEQEYYIITEYAAGGEVIDHIAKQEHLSEKEARRFFREIVSAIDHCHLSGVLHRDLKLENILLSAEKHILITDFGLGRSYQEGNLCGTFCGTPLYAAPELVSGIKYHGPPADIWAMGVVLYAMVCGKPPFQADNMSELYKKIKSVEYKFPDWCTNEFKELISKIFVKDTSERMTMDEIRNHPWVVGEYGTPPLRLEPTGPVHQLNATDSKVEHLKGISYESNALLYSFHEVTSSRDIHRPRKEAVGPVTQIDMNRRSHSHDSDLDLQAGVRLTIPRPRDDPLMDREALTASPPHVMSMDSHLTDLASTLHLGNVPTAPLKAALSRRDASETESEFVRTFHAPFKRYTARAPVPATMQPRLPDMSARRVSVITDGELFNPISMPQAITHQADLAAAASSFGRQPAGRRRASMVSMMASNSADRLPLRSTSDLSKNHPVSPSMQAGGAHAADSSMVPTDPQPRSVRAGFNLAATSATYTPQELVAEVQRVLTMLNIYHVQLDDFLLACTYNSSYERVEIEIEVVRVWLLNTHGIQLRRKSGSTWLYKQLYSSIVNALILD